MVIREARLEDAPALIALERLCPEMGRVSIRLDLRVTHFELAGRYPSSKGYVALREDGSTIIGTIFSSVAPTQLNGKLLPAAYLFSLRVHPKHRLRGVASMLIAHACQRALEEEGVRTTWAAVVEGNHASLQTFKRVGFERVRDLRAKAILGGWRRTQVIAQRTREASLPDIRFMADAANHYHSSHNFWRLLTPELLQAQLGTARHSTSDAEILLAEDGRPVAAVSGWEIARAARVTLLSLAALPRAFDRLLSPAYQLLPLNALLARHYFSPPDQPALFWALIRALHRRYFPRAFATIVVADPLEPASRGLDLPWGVEGRVHLVVKSDEAIDQSRPSYMG